MSAVEWRKARKYLKEQGIKTRNPDRIFEAHERLQKRTEESAEKTKAARRAMEMKRIHAGQRKRACSGRQKQAGKG